MLSKIHKTIFNTETIDSLLEQYRGVGPGFDFLRIALALSVLLTHSVIIAQGEIYQFRNAPLELLHDTIIPMFFALSGFLIAGSALRLRLRDFILNRGMRIVPALCVDILLSALILGPIFTTLPLVQYFFGHDFYSYFLNVFGWIHYNLPGVFKKNPLPDIVNWSLWTVTFEIACYVIISVFILFGWLKNRWMAVIAVSVVFLLIAISHWFKFEPTTGDSIGLGIAKSTLHALLLPHGRELYVYFLLGALFYLFRHKIIYNFALFILCLTVFFIGAFQGFDFLPEQIRNIIYYPITVYMTVFLGMTKFPSLPIYRNGDYSYGIYLYGFPLQQALVSLFPKLTSPLLHFIISVPLVTLVAMGSWHFIEKPLLGLRRKFSFTARKGDGHLSMSQPSFSQ